MVSFTCNACGQTVKKTKVEKHYQTECRDCTVLSCLDCGKDFYGDDYASHTSCISEAEKYQGKLYKDPNRGQPPKGEKKQLVWLEKVKQAAVASPATNPKLSRLLERLQEYTNIPRKMKKFQNFVRNSLNVRDQKTLDELWSMFSGLQAGCDGTATTETDNDEKLKTSMLKDDTDDKVEADKVKKKKKKRHSEIDNDGVATTGVDNDEKAETSVLEDGTVTVDDKAEADKMKKKKKKRHSEIDNDGVATTEADNDKKPEISMLEDSMGDKVEANKMKKKKKKRNSEIDNDGVTTTGLDNDEKTETSVLEDGTVTVDDRAEADKLKKRKKKRFETDHTEVVGDESMAVSEEDVLSSTKKHKKTHHNTDSEDVTGNTNQLDIQLLSDSQPPVIDESVIKKRKKSKKKSPEQEVQCISDQRDTTKDTQHTGTNNAVEDNISHWISSIIDSGAVKKKKDKRRQYSDDSVATDQSFTACTNADSTKQSKSKERDVNNQAVMEDSEVMVVEQKKKRKSRATVELQAADETEIPLVKKHKKKK